MLQRKLCCRNLKECEVWEPVSAFRGLVNATLISLIFWIAIGIMLYTWQ